MTEDEGHVEELAVGFGPMSSKLPTAAIRFPTRAIRSPMGFGSVFAGPLARRPIAGGFFPL